MPANTALAVFAGILLLLTDSPIGRKIKVSNPFLAVNLIHP
jgi:hypothetical protein